MPGVSGGPLGSRATRGRVVFGALCIDYDRYVVEIDGIRVPLTRLEFDIMDKLAHNVGCMVSYRDLAEKVFHNSFTPESTALRVHLAHLRRKLGRAGASIVTVRGRGLLWNPSY